MIGCRGCSLAGNFVLRLVSRFFCRRAICFHGDFTIRELTTPEKLSLVVIGTGTSSGTIKSSMAFDRKDYGMQRYSFIKIANRVEVAVDLQAKRVGGPPVDLKQ